MLTHVCTNVCVALSEYRHHGIARLFRLLPDAFESRWSGSSPLACCRAAPSSACRRANGEMNIQRVLVPSSTRRPIASMCPSKPVDPATCIVRLEEAGQIRKVKLLTLMFFYLAFFKIFANLFMPLKLPVAAKTHVNQHPVLPVNIHLPAVGQVDLDLLPVIGLYFDRNPFIPQYLTVHPCD